MTRILLVEDDNMLQDILAERLEFRDFDVILAADGQTGIEKAKTENPDIILMDMRLPIIDGWEATRQLKSRPETHHIPIIAQFSEELESETLNGKQYPVITLLGTDGKEYKYRLERPEKEKERDPLLT